METRRIITGVFVWTVALFIAWSAVARQLKTVDSSIVQMKTGMTQWITGQQTVFEAKCPRPLAIAVGDPVFMKQPDGQYRQIGRVQNNFGAPIETHLTEKIRLELYDSALADCENRFEVRYYGAPTTLDWVARTMLPPEKQKQIADTIAAEWKLNQDEILRRLNPLVEQSLQRAVSVVEAELPKSIERHRGEFAKLGERYKSEMLRDQLVPLAKERVLPIMEEEIRPLANEIGRELWDRVSLWSFTWRAIYDASPLPERNALKTEFDRFLDEEAIPVLQSRSPEFVAATERILRRIGKDPVVNETFRRNLREIASDPAMHQIVWSIVQESVIENQALRESLREEWKRPEVRETLQAMSSRFEPTARKIGDLIVGSREKGVTPEFARILRVQILVKDRRWLILEPVSSESPGVQARRPEDGPLQLIEAKDSMPFPLVFEGSQQSPLSKIR